MHSNRFSCLVGLLPTVGLFGTESLEGYVSTFQLDHFSHVFLIPASMDLLVDHWARYYLAIRSQHDVMYMCTDMYLKKERQIFVDFAQRVKVSPDSCIVHLSNQRLDSNPGAFS